ncbi:hypothetical protein CHARACLAT_023431 [Characodon lateralis]|uniref:Uncharacterized protein n=1 Tax=Characodon lateralis TaxID=208331 RepID=A0ABU7E2W0_9TELE|nr:hypothetical protein [Characodon lateralis]
MFQGRQQRLEIGFEMRLHRPTVLIQSVCFISGPTLAACSAATDHGGKPKGCSQSLLRPPLPRILSPDSVLPALTLFLSPDRRLLLSHWVCKPDSQLDIVLLPPDDH